jgi:hypothetical protein
VAERQDIRPRVHERVGDEYDESKKAGRGWIDVVLVHGVGDWRDHVISIYKNLRTLWILS